ncbi:hypothetical protein PINS_up014494 [Pythium insidiosum]|nr:hypothetical protein PINS_up014494 [Pythium insidiosum]
MTQTHPQQERAEDDSVAYWRMPPQQQHEQRKVTHDGSSSATSSDEELDQDEYELLYPSDEKTQKLLDQSEFFNTVMPRSDHVSESILAFCGSFVVRMGPVVVTSLIRRFTDARFNWANKTLQSFLELSCWISVTCAAYTLYRDWVFAFQVGTIVGAIMSVCDEVVIQFVRGLARVIRNQKGGSELLQRLGFDVPVNGKAPTNGHEVELLKNLVFGYLGVVATRSIWDHYHDIKLFALMTAAVGVAFIVTAELFCLWLPTRRIGLTLQSRFTKIRQNWSEHPVRSLVELLAWTVSTTYFFHSSEDFFYSLQLGTSVAVAVCIASGLDDLPDIVTSDDDRIQSTVYSFWQDHLSTDPFMKLASGMVGVEDVFSRAWRGIETEAIRMYENWGQ